MTAEQQQLLRSLPSISGLLEAAPVREWLAAHPRSLVVEVLQDVVDEARRSLIAGESENGASMDAILLTARRRLDERSAPGLVRVINATGVVLHTGLGRAPLSRSAVEAIAESAGGYANLELDLASGSRGRRQGHVADLIRSLTGAEAATVVNNNAAATLLILRALAEGREVVVSRGELIEIGGSFRLPEIMTAGGARLREVGTTNRTRIGDYEAAIGDDTALLLWVHTSNFRMIGFCESVSVAELSELAHRFGLVAVADLGSGALFDLRRFGLPYEPFAREAIEQGADLVCFSGDKLLGGPQCGIICGRADLIAAIERHPLMRTYRVDKLTVLALQETLRCYQDPQRAIREVPVLAALGEPTDALARRALDLQEMLRAALPKETFIVCSDEAYAGGGTLPACPIESVVVQWRPATRTADSAVERMRHSRPPLVARIRDGAVVFDLRTIRPGDYEAVVSAVRWAVDGDGG